MADKEFSVRQILDIFYRNTKSIVLLNAFILLIPIFLIIFLPNVYESRTLLQVEPRPQSLISGFDDLSSDSGTDLDLQEEIYLSRMVLEQVIDELKLDTNVERLQKKIKRITKQSASVFRVSQGGLLEFYVRDTDQEKAKLILNTANKIYINQNISRYSEEARNSIDFLDENIDRIEKNLAGSTELLREFKTDKLPYDISLEAQANLDNLIKIEQAISDLEIREEEISQFYKKTSPVYLTLLNQKEVLINQRDRLQVEISSLPDKEREFIELSRGVEINQNALEIMLNRRIELSVIEAGTIGNIRVIDEAYVLRNPVSPQPISLFAIFIFLGGICSIIMIFIREYFLKRIISPQDISEYIENRSLLGVTPNLYESSFTESVETMVTNFLLTDKNKISLVTGPTPGVGKTTMVYHFSTRLASLGKKVLVLDLDLRRGDLHENFKVDKSKGFNDYGSYNIQKITENISFVSRGTKLKSIFSILNSNELKDFITSNKNNYDYIIIDTPPVLSVGDAIGLIDLVDYTILVTRANISKMEELRVSIDLVEQRSEDYKVDAIIINDFNKSSFYYGYDYYSYKYSGNYDYTKQD